MATLPDKVRFSQGSLQDFSDCRRRFLYRYIQHLAWPALEAEPALENERFMRQGAEFHRLVHQAVLAIPHEQLIPPATSADLLRWWEHFLEYPPLPDYCNCWPEITLLTPVAGRQLVAKFDLIQRSDDGIFTIYDWKTSRRRPQREQLAARAQTRVYPYVLTHAGHTLNAGKPVPVDKIRMIYWFADFPQEPEVFHYDEQAFQKDGVYLQEMIHEIMSLSKREDYPLTTNSRACSYCVYRSLCDRGIHAGGLMDMEFDLDRDDLDFELDFDQIAEIAF